MAVYLSKMAATMVGPTFSLAVAEPECCVDMLMEHACSLSPIVHICKPIVAKVNFGIEFR